MIYIGGISVLHPCRKLKRYILRQKQIWRTVSKFINMNSRYDAATKTGKTMSILNTGMPSRIPINSIYWPVGGNRFGVGLFLVSESDASAIFAMSLSRSPVTLMYDKLRYDVSRSYCMPWTSFIDDSEINKDYEEEEEEDSENSGSEEEENYSYTGGNEGESGYPHTEGGEEEEDKSDPHANLLSPDPVYTATHANNPEYHFNLMPLQVIATQRSKFMNPFHFQSYFATWMIPIVYIPIVDSDNIIYRSSFFKESSEADGCGLLLMVDQRYLWQFVYVPKLWMPISSSSSESNRTDYNSWYRLLNILRSLLLKEQTGQEYLEPYGRKFFHDIVHPSPDDSREDEDDQELEIEDDTNYLSFPIDFVSDGQDYTLAEVFALIEQSLDKRLLFHPNWQIELINSVSARFRFIRNTLFFTPRVAYFNENLWYEIGLNISEEQRDVLFHNEFPIQSGGLLSSWPTRAMKRDDDGNLVVLSQKVLFMPEIVRTFALPHYIECVGNLYAYSGQPNEINFSRDSSGIVYPYAYTYYRCCLVNKEQRSINGNADVDDIENVMPFFYDEYGNKIVLNIFSNIFIPGSLMGKNPRANYDFSSLIVTTSHLSIARILQDEELDQDNENEGSEDEYQGNEDEEETSDDNENEDMSNRDPRFYNKEIENKAEGWRLGRTIVRNMLGWLIFPFTWHFKNMNYWPLTGFEDYLLFKNNGSVFVAGMQPCFLSKKMGVKYVGRETSTVDTYTEPHYLLDIRYHYDTREVAYIGFVKAIIYIGARKPIEINELTVDGEPIHTWNHYWG